MRPVLVACLVLLAGCSTLPDATGPDAAGGLPAGDDGTPSADGQPQSGEHGENEAADGGAAAGDEAADACPAPSLSFEQARYAIDDGPVTLRATFRNGCEPLETVDCQYRDKARLAIEVDAGPFSFDRVDDGVGLPYPGSPQLGCKASMWAPDETHTWNMTWNGTVMLHDHRDMADRPPAALPWRVPGAATATMAVGHLDAAITGTATIEVAHAEPAVPEDCAVGTVDATALEVVAPASASVGEVARFEVRHAFATDQCTVLTHGFSAVAYADEGPSVYSFGPHCTHGSDGLIVPQAGRHEGTWVLEWDGTSCGSRQPEASTFDLTVYFGGQEARTTVTWD